MSLLRMLGGLWKGKKSAKRPATRKGKKSAKKSPKKAIPKNNKKKAPKPKKKILKKQASSKVKAAPKEKPIGIVTHYFGKISVGIIKLKSELKLGDKIRIQGKHDNVTQAIASMQINHQAVAKAKKGDEIGIKVLRRVHENSKVFRA